ncbi:MAG: branched-chain amino acid ABC transporter ATP-binding protein [Acidimicrobiia bacterium]
MSTQYPPRPDLPYWDPTNQTGSGRQDQNATVNPYPAAQTTPDGAYRVGASVPFSPVATPYAAPGQGVYFAGSRPPREHLEPPALVVDSISVFFGPVQVLDKVSVAVWERERVCILGSNGSGKSTTLKAIAGIVPVREGKIVFRGFPLHVMDADRIVRKGITLIPQGRKVFYDQTVEANLLLGAYSRKDKHGIKADLEAVYGRWPVLGERRRQLAGNLSGGEQQMLAVGRALMSRPSFLMLDEPSLGLSPVAIDMLFDGLDQLAREGLTILIVEQLATHALRIAERGYVLDQGRVVAWGTVNELRTSGAVMEAYLGRSKTS